MRLTGLNKVKSSLVAHGDNTVYYWFSKCRKIKR